MVFLFVSMVILRPLDLKISLTSCFVSLICLAVATWPLNFGVMRDNM